jgi:hypothetical protein
MANQRLVDIRKQIYASYWQHSYGQSYIKNKEDKIQFTIFVSLQLVISKNLSVMSSSESFFPALPKSGISFINTPLLQSALEYCKKHMSPSALNHCLRSACFAVLLSPRLPLLSGEALDMELVVYSCLMHDLGWATTKELLSTDKRFEVDSANLARQFVLSEASGAWDKHRMQLSWDAIALHTTPSIAHHKELEVVLVQFGIRSDFMGPNLPPKGMISPEEFREVLNAFPRLGFKDELIHIMCGLCRDKPETTLDNVASLFGVEYGIDGNGTGKEEFSRRLAEIAPMRTGVAALTACEEYE